MKNKKLFLRRLQITVVLLILYFLASSVPLPFSGSNNLDSLLSQMAAINGATNDGLKLFSLGLMPYFMSTLVVKILTQGISPTLSEMSRGTPKQREKFDKIKNAIFYFIALSQSVTFIPMNNWLNTGETSSLTSMPSPIVVVLLFAGALLCKFIAEQITQRGITNGFTLIISSMLLRNMFAGLSKSVGVVELSVFFINLSVLLSLLIIAILLQKIVVKLPVTIDTFAPNEEGVIHQGLIRDSFRVNLLCAGITPIIYLSLFNPIIFVMGVENEVVLTVVSLAAIYIFTDITIKSDFNASRLTSIFLSKGVYMDGGYKNIDEMKNKIKMVFSRIIVVNTIVLFGYYLVNNLIYRVDLLSVIKESQIGGIQILLLAYASLDIFNTVKAYFVKDAVEVVY